MKKTLLEVKNLRKTYISNKKEALKGLNFKLDEGEIVGFIGPNGSGKSTCINSIVGAIDFDGEIYLNNYNIKKEDTLAKKELGFVPDNIDMFDYLTGREFINFVASSHKMSKEDIEKELIFYSKRLQIDMRLDERLSTYSKGMKQKVSIISALIHSPKILILDEPLNGIDPFAINELKTIMKELKEKGVLIFFSSHILDVVEKLCTRILFIQDGRIKKDTTLEELHKIIENEKLSLEEIFIKIMGE